MAYDLLTFLTAGKFIGFASPQKTNTSSWNWAHSWTGTVEKSTQLFSLILILFRFVFGMRIEMEQYPLSTNRVETILHSLQFNTFKLKWSSKCCGAVAVSGIRMPMTWYDHYDELPEERTDYRHFATRMDARPVQQLWNFTFSQEINEYSFCHFSLFKIVFLLFNHCILWLCECVCCVRVLGVFPFGLMVPVPRKPLNIYNFVIFAVSTNRRNIT